MTPTSEKSIRTLFLVSLIVKALFSAIEILGGILFLFTGTATSILTYLTNQELLEDPSDFFANHIQQFLPYLATHSQLFFALYLLSHGLVKIFLVINLLRNKIWAYPWTLVVLGLFIIYQLYRLTFGFSITLIALTVFDVLLVWLTWHEYMLVKKHIINNP